MPGCFTALQPSRRLLLLPAHCSLGDKFMQSMDNCRGTKGEAAGSWGSAPLSLQRRLSEEGTACPGRDCPSSAQGGEALPTHSGTGSPLCPCPPVNSALHTLPWCTPSSPQAWRALLASPFRLISKELKRHCQLMRYRVGRGGTPETRPAPPLPSLPPSLAVHSNLFHTQGKSGAALLCPGTH